MILCCKHICESELSILLITHLFLPVSKSYFDLQFQHLKGFTALLNVWEAGPCNKSYYQEIRARVNVNRL